MRTSDLRFSIRSDLGVVGQTEDHEDIVAQHLYVIGEAADGTRFAHFKRYATKRVESGQDNDGYPYTAVIDTEAESTAAAEDLLSKIEGTNACLSMDFWSPIDPAYGSAAYVRAEPEIVARERTEDLHYG